ncbi:hypothetical protein PYW07_006993 [Mythimna separata]|uniref:Uncharacterized protein n=1 Tax=Mythimna separata TaxID=271217 RepID=A0AAD8E0S2_MYTSE|nr:hypothetical protein PYW07_006993 [Mythimna separata]
MALKLYFCLILIVVCVSVNSFSNIQLKRIILTYDQGALRHSSLNRFRRQISGFGNQPTVVVVPSGGTPVYRGPGSSYGPPTGTIPTSYGRYGSQAYGASNPAVIVKMAEGSSCTKKKKKKKIFE